MRIVKISIKNLNSLVGHWEIDLDNPEIAASGIFAICGPTGAGKSTILDAMSLALYGRTPRLESVNQSENDIMSQSTGECSSELVFEAKGTRYKAFWTQQRARKKPDGKLQPAKPELSVWNNDTQAWEILATQKTKFDAEIARVTGLSYEEFTRSILLAQGSFAAFLKAKSEVRSAALEKITGTEVYSQISKRVQRQYAYEKDLVDKLDIRLNGVTPLTEDERKALQSELDQAQTQQKALALEVKKLSDMRAWKVKVTDGEAAVAKTAAEVEAAKAAYDTSLLQKPRLDAARAAAGVLEYFDARIHAQKQLAETQAELKGLVEREPVLKQQKSAAQSAFEASQKAYATIETQSQALQKTLVEVRALDGELKHLGALKADEEADIKALTVDLSGKNKSLEKAKLDQAAELAKIEKLSPLKDENHPEQKLAVEAGDIKVLFDRFESARVEHAERKKKYEAAVAKEQSDKKALDAVAPKLADLEAKLKKADADIAELEDKSAAALAGKTLADWRNLDNQGQENLRENASLKDLFQKAQKTAANIESLKSEVQTLTTQKTARHEEAAALALTLEALEKEQQLIAEKKRFADLVEQFQAAREELHEGKPCPLCGALEHPWAKDLPVASVDAKREKTIQKEIDAAQKKRTAALEKEALAQGSIAAKTKAIESAAAEVALLEKSQAGLAQKLELPMPLTIEVLAFHAMRTLQQCNAAKETVKQLEALEAAIKKCAKAKDLIVAEQKALTQKSEAARIAHAQSVADVKSTLEALEASRQAGKATLTDLMGMLKCHGYEPDEKFTELKAVKDNIETRLKTLDANLKTLSACEVKAGELKSQIVSLSTAIAELRQSSEAHTKKIAELKTQFDQKRQKRTELFGDKACDAEEKAMAQVLSAAKTKSEAAQKALLDVSANLDGLNGRIQATGTTLAKNETTAQETSQQWEEKRTQSGFTTDELWQAARMPADALSQAERAMEAARTRLSTLSETLKKHKEELTQLTAKVLTDKPLNVLDTELEEKNRQAAACNESLGSAKARIDADDALKLKQAELIKEREKQAKTMEVWSKLNVLIGSADGKKYRQFVQSITFDTLLDFANDALRLMTERYLLKRDETDDREPLGINVIDNYQGGIERSSKNLSGGETFIVSLALSLGLSKMAGRNVRIESLFLDEGFGTLDADALDNALSTLATLNSQGKLIGIISHVGEIRERIGARIEVEPMTGGISRLSGPGVRRLD